MHVEAVRPEVWDAQVSAAPFEECGEPHRVILHHTAIADPALKQGDPPSEAAYMRRIERLHQERGWLAVGYHFVIMPSGRVFAGRPTWAVGAHAAGHNRGAIGIALAGDFEEELPTRAAIGSLARLRGSLPLVPHGDLMPTACPGALLREAVRVGFPA